MLNTDFNRLNMISLIEQLMPPNQTILFAGAGVSCAAGYPGWKTLMDKMEEKLVEKLAGPRGATELKSPKDIVQIKNTPDILWQAEEYKQVLGEEVFNQILLREFKPGRFSGPSRIASDLLKLKFAHVLTTNFEPSLEAEFSGKNRDLGTR